MYIEYVQYISYVYSMILYVSNFFLEKAAIFFKKKKDTFWGKVTYFGKSNSFLEKVTFSIKSNFFWEKLLFPQKLASSTLVNLPPDRFVDF